MDNLDRKIELSGKMTQMGRSLITEGQNINDYAIAQSGSIMLLISSLLVSDEDMFLFSEICAMFSAKKIMDEKEGHDTKSIITNLMNKKQNQSSVKKKSGRRKKTDDGEV